MIKDKSIEELFDMAKKGDSEAIEYIVKSNMRLVYSICKKYSGRCIEFEDAVQIGALALMISIQRYDPKIEAQFSTFATWNIKGKIFQYVRDYRKDVPFKIPRKNYNEYKQIKRIRKEYESLQREPTIEELAKEMKITVQEVSKTLNLIENRFGLDSPIKDSKDDYKNRNLSEVLINPNELTEDQIIDQIVIQDAIKKLPNREKQVIELRFFKDKSQDNVGKELGISQPTVMRTEKSALKNLKAILTGKEAEVSQTKEYNRREFNLDITKIDLSCLSKRQKQVVCLVHGEGLTFAEVGRRLGINRATAYATMREAYRKLEKIS